MTSVDNARLSRKWSILGWSAAAGIGILTSYLLILLTAFAFLVIPFLLLPILFRYLPLQLCLFIVIFGLVIAVGMLRALIPRRDKSQVIGLPLDLAAQPRLHAEITRIAGVLRTALPAEVYLIPGANAFVAQHGGIFGLGGRRVMGIGLPLLQTLNISEFRALLAHEFAHFYSGDTRLGPFLNGTRDTIARVFQSLNNGAPVPNFFTSVVLAYGRLFMRLTRFISRKQEFRSDELACYVAGPEPLIEGLKTIHKSAVVTQTYWQSVVFPAVQSGHQPKLAEGFGHFMIAPQVKHAASVQLEQQLKTPTISPFDTHPPLSARIQRACNVQVPSVEIDRRPAISLLDNLPELELGLLHKLLPPLAYVTLKRMEWESLGREVYLPVWRAQVAPFHSFLTNHTIAGLPTLLKQLSSLAKLVKNPPGRLLTSEQKIDIAANIVQLALSVSLANNGWTLQTIPGYTTFTCNGLTIDPASTIAQLRSGRYPPADWFNYCSKAGIAQWPLAGVAERYAAV